MMAMFLMTQQCQVSGVFQGNCIVVLSRKGGVVLNLWGFLTQDCNYSNPFLKQIRYNPFISCHFPCLVLSSVVFFPLLLNYYLIYLK